MTVSRSGLCLISNIALPCTSFTFFPEQQIFVIPAFFLSRCIFCTIESPINSIFGVLSFVANLILFCSSVNKAWVQLPILSLPRTKNLLQMSMLVKSSFYQVFQGVDFAS